MFLTNSIALWGDFHLTKRSDTMLKVKAYAKINLTLDVLCKRPDGYHEVEMLMQSVSLADTVSVRKTDSGITLLCNKEGVPLNEKNTAYKAAKLFLEDAQINSGVEITIEKVIPMQAGMAGGSADAAGVLFALSELFGKPLPTETLLAIAQKVGADVPFCLLGGTRLASGIGEILTEKPSMPDCFIAIVKPNENISTGSAYALVDSCENLIRPDNKAAITALESGDLKTLSKEMRNVFEQATGTKKTAAIKETLIKHGALGSIMTGSGSAVFGIFTDRQSAEKALCDAEFADCETFISVPVSVGCEII